MNPNNPVLFLVDILFDIYIAILLLRFLLQYVGADFYNPISQFIVKVTQPLVKHARKIVPGYRGLDIATLLLVLAFIVIKTVILLSLVGSSATAAAIGLHALHDLVSLVFDVFIIAIFIQAILSWVNPDPRNPVMGVLNSLTTPVLRPVRNVVKPIGGLDLSPIVALIGLMFLKRLALYLFQLF